MLIAFDAQSDRGLQAFFELQYHSGPMLIEVNIDFTGSSDQKRQTLTRIKEVIHDIGHPPDPHCPDCDWFQVMSIVKHCYDEAVRTSTHVSTTVRILDANARAAAGY